MRRFMKPMVAAIVGAAAAGAGLPTQAADIPYAPQGPAYGVPAAPDYAPPPGAYMAPPTYVAPPVYAAPQYTAPQVVVVPPPVYYAEPPIVVAPYPYVRGPGPRVVYGYPRYRAYGPVIARGYAPHHGGYGYRRW